MVVFKRMKRVKYEIPQIRVFQVVETEGILAGSGSETTFAPSVTPRTDGGEEALDGDTYDASGGDTSTPQP
jgi:hypothetical protein